MNRKRTMSDRMSRGLGLSSSMGVWLLAGAVFGLEWLW